MKNGENINESQNDNNEAIMEQVKRNVSAASVILDDDTSKNMRLKRYGWGAIPMFMVSSFASMLIITIALSFFIQSIVSNPLESIIYSTAIASPATILAYILIFALPFACKQRTLVGGYGFNNATVSNRFPASSENKSLWKMIGTGILYGVASAAIVSVLRYVSAVFLSGGKVHKFIGYDSILSISFIKNFASWDVPIPLVILFFLNFVNIIVAFPICEELFFRGLIGLSFENSNIFKKYANISSNARKLLICLIIMLLYGLVTYHASIFFNGYAAVDFIAQTVIIGFGFSWLALYKFKTITPTIIAHIAYNIIYIAVTFFIL